MAEILPEQIQRSTQVIQELPQLIVQPAKSQESPSEMPRLPQLQLMEVKKLKEL